MTSRYKVGSHPTYVAPGALVMTGEDNLEQLCALAAGEISVVEVISALSNGDLRTLPDFLIAVPEDAGIRVVARGEFRATSGDWVCSGLGVATWNEQVLTDLAGAGIVVSAGVESGPELPLVEGVVLAGAVTWRPGDAPLVAVAALGGRVESAPGEPALVDSVDPVGPVAAVRGAMAHGAVESDLVDTVQATVAPEVVDPGRETSALVVPESVPDAGDADGDADSTEQSVEPTHEPALEPAPESFVELAMEPDTENGVPVPPMAVPARDEPMPDPNATRVESDDVFDAMFGATIHGRRPEDAAIREKGEIASIAPVTPPPPPPSPPEAPPGDHDGRTITAASMREQRRLMPAASVGGKRVATLHLTSGQEVVVDRPVLLGRSPRSAQASSSALPSIVVVDDPYVSSTHLEVAFVDGALVATDRSSNGTVLKRPGQGSERLVKDVPTVVTDGCLLSLSDDFVATVRLGGS